MDQLLRISPVDGRYAERCEILSPLFSEFGLIRHRLIVMAEWVIAMNEFLGGEPRKLTTQEKRRIRSFADIDVKKAGMIKQIETNGVFIQGYGKIDRTNHDVKACELYLRYRFSLGSLADFVERIHFGGTSMDVDNIAYALMLHEGIHDVLLPAFRKLEDALGVSADRYADLPMLARTHGQAASPTTLGKECNVFRSRLARQVEQLRNYKLLVKLNGASGNYNSLYAAYPDHPWIEFTHDFVRRMNRRMRRPAFEANLVTTQIEPHDTYAELFGIIMRANTVLIDLCADEWRYVSDHWLAQTPDGVGSSAMPHKVNPIDFENAEGNLGFANSNLEFFSRKLPQSRLQRDLSDSTVQRNFGYTFALCLIAYGSIAKGLRRVSPNEPVIRAALEGSPEVISEAYQTILRRAGFPDAYGALKSFTQGRDVTLDDLHAFVYSLSVPGSVKDELLHITPSNYLGIAPELARR